MGVSLILTPGAAFHEIDERARVGAPHIEEEEARRHAGLGMTQFSTHVGVDQRERNEGRKTEAKRQHDGGRESAWPMDRRKRHPPFNEARRRRPSREIGDAKGDQSQREKRRDGRAGHHGGDRSLRAGQDGERDQRRARERRADKVALTRPASPFLDHVADEGRHGQIVRASERRD